jgi:Arc/MetJ family transcription regulator
MRTTLDLPEELLEKAMQVSNTPTKTRVIILALEELIRKSTIAELKNFKGAVDLEIDLDTLRDRV